jgi:hypothetical protein
MTLLTGSLGATPFYVTSIIVYSHQSNLVWQIETSLEISRDFKASKNNA